MEGVSIGRASCLLFRMFGDEMHSFFLDEQSLPVARVRNWSKGVPKSVPQNNCTKFNRSISCS